MTTHSRLILAFGDALRERREALGSRASQQDVARRAGITVRHLQKLESGTSNPKLDTLIAVAIALKTNLQTLLDRADEIATKTGKAS